jgi:hypothetical protein
MFLKLLWWKWRILSICFLTASIYFLTASIKTNKTIKDHLGALPALFCGGICIIYYFCKAKGFLCIRYVAQITQITILKISCFEKWQRLTV